MVNFTLKLILILSLTYSHSLALANDLQSCRQILATNTSGLSLSSTRGGVLSQIIEGFRGFINGVRETRAKEYEFSRADKIMNNNNLDIKSHRRDGDRLEHK